MLMTQHFDYCPSASEGDNQSVRSSAPEVSRCFPGGYNVKLYISRVRLAWWLLAFLHSAEWSCLFVHFVSRHAVYLVMRDVFCFIGQMVGGLQCKLLYLMCYLFHCSYTHHHKTSTDKEIPGIFLS